MRLSLPLIVATTLRGRGAGGSPPVITTASLPAALTSVPYSVTPEVTGDVDSFSITSGALPAGLSVNASTGAITGTATIAAGGATATFTYTATNAYGSDSVSLSITVNWSTLYDYTEAEAAAGYAQFSWRFNEAAGAIVNYGAAGTTYNLTVNGTPTRQVTSPLGDATAIDLPGSTAVYFNKASIPTTLLPQATIIHLYYPRSQGASSAGEMALFFGATGEWKFNGGDNLVRMRGTATITSSATNITIPSHLNNWHMVFWTYDDNGDRKWHAYRYSSGSINEIVGTATAANGTASDMGGIRVGYRFDGAMALLQLENRILTNPQMQKMADLAFGVGDSEVYSNPFLANAAFDADALTTTQRDYYDQVFAAFADATGNARTESVATYQTGGDYAYAIGRTLGSWLFSVAGAFRKTGDDAILTEMNRIMELVWTDREHINNPGEVGYSALNETLMFATVSLHALILDANTAFDGGKYAADAAKWKAWLVDRVATQHGGAIPYDDLAHTFSASLFSAFAMYMLTGTSSYIALARQHRETLIADLAIYSALKPSPTNRIMQFHRMPYAASTVGRYWQPGHYARYTFMYWVMLHECGFEMVDMANLAHTVADMFTDAGAEWYYVCGDDDGGVDLSGTEHPALANETERAVDSAFTLLSKYDTTGALVPRCEAAQALDPYYFRNPNISAGLLFGS